MPAVESRHNFAKGKEINLTEPSSKRAAYSEFPIAVTPTAIEWSQTMHLQTSGVEVVHAITETT